MFKLRGVWELTVKRFMKQTLRRLVRRGLIGVAFFGVFCFCVWLHLRSLPEEQPLSVHAQQLLDCTWQEAGQSLLQSTGRLWTPFLELATAFGGFFVDVIRIVFLWVKFVYPLLIPLASAAADLYLQTSVEQRVCVVAGLGAFFVLNALRTSGVLLRLRLQFQTFYTSATQWVVLSAPLGLMLLLHASLCLMFGGRCILHLVSSLWLAVPVSGSVLFGLRNISLRNQSRPNARPSDLKAQLDVSGQDQRLEVLLRSFRSLTFWLMLWTAQRLLDFLSWTVEALPLPFSIYRYASTLHLHAFSCLLILVVITGGPSSLLIFVQGQRCVRGLAIAFNWMTAKTLGIILLIPRSEGAEREAERVELLLAKRQLGLRSKADVDERKADRNLKPTWQLARVFGFSVRKTYALHCLPDFDPLEEVLPREAQEVSAGLRGTVLTRLRSVATSVSSIVARGGSKDGSANPSSIPNVADSSGLASFLLSKVAPLEGIAEWCGVRLPQRLMCFVTPAIQFSPELLLFFLPGFLLRPALLLLLLGLPVLGTVSCFERKGSLSERIFWLAYYVGASVVYSAHNAFEEDGLLSLLPFPLTRLLVSLWILQFTAKALSARAYLCPTERTSTADFKNPAFALPASEAKRWTAGPPQSSSDESILLKQNPACVQQSQSSEEELPLAPLSTFTQCGRGDGDTPESGERTHCKSAVEGSRFRRGREESASVTESG